MKLRTLAACTLAIAAAALPAFAQVMSFSKEDMIRFTAASPFDRFNDGRPKVPDELLKKVEGLSIEEAWGLLREKGYVNQFEVGWKILHPEKKLVGRAVTAVFMPVRPDLAKVADDVAKSMGFLRNSNQRVIDTLQPGDVLVVDLFGKIEGGTIVGDNLAAAVFNSTKTGIVVDGAIRDLEGVFPIPMGLYYRGVHPSAINNVMLVGVNVPIRIGNTVVMPGDVVLGDRGGVGFIPPQFVKEIVDRAEETHVHDEWTKMKLLSGKYKSLDVYPSPTREDLKKEYEEFKKQRLGK